MNEIIYGMPTLIECDTLEECVSLCKDLGLDFIEINMNLPQYQKNNMDIEKIKKIAEENNIFFTIHLDENLNVCDFNSDISKAYIDTVMFAIEAAKELNIPILNMHMAKGVYFTLPDRKIYLFEKYKDIFLSKLIEFREICKKVIGESKISICIENSDWSEPFIREGINLLLESEVFQLTWDIGHDHSTGNRDSEVFYNNIHRLKHMHIHDGIGKKNHLPLGTGEIDIADRLRIAKENSCRCVLETKTIEGLRESVKYIRLSGN